MSGHLADLRITELAVHFRQRGDTQMRDLPFYNDKLEVEAIEFRPFGADQLVGVLITPWFMNILIVPLSHEPAAMARYGEARNIPLPGATLPFRYGGDETIGAYWGHSLHSPMLKFASQAQAISEARQQLARALTAPQPAPVAASMSRRAFLTGARKVADHTPLGGLK